VKSATPLALVAVGPYVLPQPLTVIFQPAPAALPLFVTSDFVTWMFTSGWLKTQTV
jgi:hypothetical protein